MLIQLLPNEDFVLTFKVNISDANIMVLRIGVQRFRQYQDNRIYTANRFHCWTTTIISHIIRKLCYQCLVHCQCS